MASSEADLMAIGAHCDAPGCGMVDFLPFRCDCCSRNFCLDHRSYSAHACTAAGHRTTEVIVCPLCARGVRLQAGQDPNEAFEQHTASTACDPRNYAKVHKKPRCPVGRCQEKLSLINTYHCKKCNLRVCLKHRLPDDHACLQAKAAQATQVVAAAASRRAQPPAPAPAPAPASRPAAVAYPAPLASSSAARSVGVVDPSNTVKGTAARRAQQISGAPAGAGQGRGSSGAGAAAQGAGEGMSEECPHCRAKFATVERLIQHVEEWHPATTSSGAVSTTATTAGRGALPNSNGSGLTWNPLMSAGGASAGAGAGAAAGAGGAGRDVYRCHHCSSTFSDPVVLLQHSERCGQRGQTVSAGGASGDGGRSAKSDCTIC